MGYRTQSDQRRTGRHFAIVSAEDIISAQKLVQSMPICDQVWDTHMHLLEQLAREAGSTGS